MKTAAAHAYTFDDTSPLPAATKLRIVVHAGQAANDETYLLRIIQLHPHPIPLPQAGEGTNVARCAAQTLEDANGNLTQVQENYSGASAIRTTRRSFDSFDRLTSVTDGFGKTLSYMYDPNGRGRVDALASGTQRRTPCGCNRTALTDPDGSVTRYTVDALNRITTVTNLGGTTTYCYDRSSLKTKVAYPNGTTAANTYDRARRILTVVNTQGAAPVSSYAYTYDANGRGRVDALASGTQRRTPCGCNRTQQLETNGGAAETTTYAFDANDRLLQVNYPDKQTAYSYDANANRLSESTSVNGTTTPGSTIQQDKRYTYNTRNQLTVVNDLVTPANDAQYTFDANGNQTSKTQNGSVTSYIYDIKDQLIRVSQNSANLGLFSYDYQGHRIVKDMGGSIVRYAYDGNSVLVETDITGQTIAKFDYGPDRLLSMNHATEGRAYYLFDALGSVSNLTNTQGGIQARYQYDAWGNYRSTAGSSFNRFAYTGHEKDNETNLYYFKARYYDPDTGRFLNQDAYLGDINTPPSLHRYLYAYANPTVYVDLTGYSSYVATGEEFDELGTELYKEGNKIGAAAVAVGSAFYRFGTGFFTGGTFDEANQAITDNNSLGDAAKQFGNKQIDKLEDTVKDYVRDGAIKTTVKVAVQVGCGRAREACSTVEKIVEKVEKKLETNISLPKGKSKAESDTLPKFEAKSSDAKIVTEGDRQESVVEHVLSPSKEAVKASSQASKLTPQQKGDILVQRRKQEELAKGNKVTEEVSIRMENGKRTRADLLSEDANGNVTCIECKNGPSARLTENQKQGQKELPSKGGVLVGKNADKTGRGFKFEVQRLFEEYLIRRQVTKPLSGTIV